MSKQIILWRYTEDRKNGLSMRFVRDKRGWFRFQIRTNDAREWCNLEHAGSGYIGAIEEALGATVFKVRP